MLPKKAVKTPILELIRSLQSKKYLHGFHLVGGTALALYLGHRRSIDIDLFSDFDFDSGALLEKIQQDFNFQIFQTTLNTLKGHIGNINVDLIAHRYPLIEEISIIDGIRLLSVPDIIAMKLNAISTSGQRSKDFIDIYYLLERYDLGKMLEFYQIKYAQENVAHIIKSLIYFEDADLADWPVLVENPTLKWIDVRKRIEKLVLAYTRI